MMAKARIYPPKNNREHGFNRELSEESDEEQLNVYATLEPFSESDNDIKSIIIDQMRKYRSVSIKVKKSSRNNERFAVFSFDTSDALNYFKRAIIEKRDRILVYDRSLYFNFPKRKYNHSRSRRETNRHEDDQNRERHRHIFKIVPSRTLFVGNIEDNTDSNELRRLFEPFGELMDISIKNHKKYVGLAYSFIKYRKMSDACRAREQLQDAEFGRKRLKIGFGNASPRHALWIGGLTSSSDENEVLSEMKKISHIAAYKFSPSDNMGYVVFETISDSKRVYDVFKEGKALHSGSKLEIDFADPHTEVKELMDNVRLKDHSHRTASSSHSREYNSGRKRSRSMSPTEERAQRRRYSSSSSRSRRRSVSNDSRRSQEYERNDNSAGLHQKSEDKHYHEKSNKSMDSADSEKKDRLRLGGKIEKYEEKPSIYTKNEPTMPHTDDRCFELRRIINSYDVVWKGGIVVKSQISYVSLHLVCGSIEAVSSMVHQATLSGYDPKIAILTKRFPLLPDRVSELRKKLATAISSRDCCILIAQPSRNDIEKNTNYSQKPMKSLISYFDSKEGAGIGSIGNTSIYAFPPSPFTVEQLSTLMPHAVKALNEANKEYLMMIISR